MMSIAQKKTISIERTMLSDKLTTPEDYSPTNGDLNIPDDDDEIIDSHANLKINIH